ncbi:hypothetical protein RB653_001120 [Dictyostelium firmibasis]|uniref:Inhibitor of growth protein n=1 Tax=Dictyostelium firmibasis TaxID=79012 RepID=A0AAN7YYG0_9MYCE
MYQGKGTYLENYLDSISTLPSELNRNFALIRELDYRTYDLVEKIDKLKSNLLVTTNGTRRAVHELTDEKASRHIKQEMKQVIEYSDEKVELSNQTYELIDKHIRKLDTDLKKFETELESAEEEKKKKKSKQSHNNNTIESTTSSSSSSSLTSSTNNTSQLNSSSGGSGGHNHHSTGNKKGKARDSLTSSSSSGNISGMSSSSSSLSSRKQKSMAVDITSITGNNGDADVRVFNANPNDLDLAIDPNEPTYCFCNRVSFGEMVGCENPDCKIEWFHFECVGLTSTPKGKWYCPDNKMKIFNFLDKSENQLKNSIENNTIVKSFGFDVDQINATVNSMVHKGVNHILMVKWDIEGIKIRLDEKDNKRNSAESLKASLLNFISTHSGRVVQSDSVFSFNSHKDMMDCLLHLKREFGWVCFSDRADHAIHNPVVRWVGIMKMENNHEIFDMTDFNYY